MKKALLPLALLIFLIACDESEDKQTDFRITKFIVESFETQSTIDIGYNGDTISSMVLKSSHDISESFEDVEIVESCDSISFKYNNDGIVDYYTVYSSYYYPSENKTQSSTTTYEIERNDTSILIKHSVQGGGNYFVIKEGIIMQQSYLLKFITPDSSGLIPFLIHDYSYDSDGNLTTDYSSENSYLNFIEYDKHSNPYLSINSVLGFPMFSTSSLLSYNNPTLITHHNENTLTIDSITISYQYDDDRVINSISILKENIIEDDNVTEKLTKFEEVWIEYEELE